ncbi:NACHT domain-containing protein [Neorhodopirellula pilleata]|uniref:NACHT domain protein n=1 Tax=Neorhodopirellula pilleata TaxID=2714738 RepID=A0A5C6AH90_9BACT|nr:hypothetical protein [Neorhodopirellula pilleata]TWT98830.1 hypothetical protein Pla100_19960 [Neorhodopirellula pilleata]
MAALLGKTFCSSVEPNCLSVGHLEFAFDRWKQAWQTDPASVDLPDCSPGFPAVSIQDGYQPIEVLVSGDLMGDDCLGNERSIAFADALESFRPLSILIGEPGTGKTSTVRWLVRSILRGEWDQWEFPIPIRGQDYGDALADDPSISPLEFFLSNWLPPNVNSLSIFEPDSRCCPSQAVKDLARLARSNPADGLTILNRTLLIVDDWDRIPQRWRRHAERNLDRDSDVMTTLLTSRSQSSVSARADVRQLTIFTPKWPFVRSDREPIEWTEDRTANDSPISELSQNPAWRRMIDAFFAAHSSSPQADIHGVSMSGSVRLMEQLVRWERQRGQVDSNLPIHLNHLRALERIAYRLVTLPTGQTQRFSIDDLERVCGCCQSDVETLLRSRWLTHDSTFIEDCRFSSKAFLNHFAARHVADELPPQEQRGFLDMAIVCSQRLAVARQALTWEAGSLTAKLDGTTFRSVLHDWLPKWLAQSDSYDITTDRIAELLIAASTEPSDIDGPVPQTCHRLWSSLADCSCEQVIRYRLELLAKLNRRFLVQKLSAMRQDRDDRFRRWLPSIPTHILEIMGVVCTQDLMHRNAQHRSLVNVVDADNDADDLPDCQTLSNLVHVAFCDRDHRRLDDLWCQLLSKSQAQIGNHLRSKYRLAADVRSAIVFQLIHFVSSETTNTVDSDDTLLMTIAASRFAMLASCETDAIYLRESLEKAASVIATVDRPGSVRFVALYKTLVESLMHALAEIAPNAMLVAQRDNPVVRRVIEPVVHQLQWLVYRDRIVDSRGVVIARSTEDPLGNIRYSTPDVVQEIAETLSPRQRNDFLSYWHMVSEGDEDYRMTDRETIHRSMIMILDSDANGPLAERLAACYQDGTPPQFGTWKKNLNRVVRRCSHHPEWVAHLREIGLVTAGFAKE